MEKSMKYKLSELIDIPKLQKLMDSFYEITGVASAIIDLDGTVLTRSRWQEICTEFHRVNPETERRCIESDTNMANQAETGKPYVIYKCKNGLMDAAAPIVVEGEHIANVFTGQLLFKDPDIKYFKKQAREFEFDEKAYLKALSKVPVVSEKKIKQYLNFLSSLAEMIAETGMKQLKILKAQDALNESKDRFQAIFNNAAISIWEYDISSDVKNIKDELKVKDVRDFNKYFDDNPDVLKKIISLVKLIDVNEETLRLYGAKTKEEFFEQFGRHHIPESLETFRNAVIAYFEDKTIYECETVNLTLDGRLINIIYKVTFPRETHLLNKALATVTDITERKRTEEALRESEMRYRRISDAVTDYIFTVRIEDGQAVETTHSPASAAVTGYTSEEFASDPGLWIRMVPEEDREAVLRQASRIISGKDTEPLEHRIVRKDGNMRWVRNTPVPHRDARGKLVSYDGLIRDITEQRQLESQLFQAQKMETVGRLAGGIAHDFNNILTAIIGNVDLMLMSILSDDSRYEELNEIKKSAERAADLTRQLLAFSRRQIIVPRIIKLNNMLVETDRMLHRLIGEDIEYVTLLSEDLWNVKVDPGQIEQVLTNLVVNARDAMPDGGKITIETANVTLDEEYMQHHNGVIPGDYAMMAVSDTGTGIDEDTLSHIFEPFFTTKELGKGTGLGLSTCYGIVKQNGGNIWVYSEQDHGTTVKIYLPRAFEQSADFSGNGEQDELPDGTETVLVVEDEPSVRAMIVRMLRKRGYDVLDASNGEDALRVSDKYGPENIHLVLTDVIMPRMGGKEFSGILLERNPEIKFIYMSGYTDNSIVRHGVLEEGITFIQKPFSPSALILKVRESLDEK